MNANRSAESEAPQVPASLEAMIAERVEHELKQCLDRAAEGLHWVGPDGTILWANQTELDLLGYSREEYIGHQIAEFHVDAPVIEDILARLAKGETLENREARLRHKDGTVRHVLINSNVLWRGDEFVHTRCFTRDVTERNEREHVFRALANSIPNLAWMAGPDGRARWFNDQWYAYTGTTEAQMHGGWSGKASTTRQSSSPSRNAGSSPSPRGHRSKWCFPCAAPTARSDAS